MTDNTARSTYHDRDWLVNKYYEEELSLSDIAKICGVTTKTIHRWFNKLGIPCRLPEDYYPIKSRKMMGHPTSEETREKISIAHRGEKNHGWHGGWTMVDGYRKVSCPAHPYADRDGYVFEHRLVAERAMGKYLDPKHPVHHINGDRQDNRNENLVVCDSRAYHLMLHRRMKRIA